MKFPQSAPIGTTSRTGARNWQTSKGQKYAENYDQVFKKRRSKPGFTKVVYRNGKKEEFRHADKLSPSEMGLKLRAESI